MNRMLRLALAAGLLFWVTRLLMAGSENSPTPPTLNQVQQTAELVVLDAQLECLVTKRRAGLTGGVELILIARGSVLISTDLSEAQYVEIDESDRVAVLSLLAPKVVWARLDPQQSQVHRLTRTGLWMLLLGDAGEAELVELAWREAQARFIERGADQALIQQARQHAERVLGELFSQTGWTVKVQWR